jgi:hypothetical protein
MLSNLKGYKKELVLPEKAKAKIMAAAAMLV